MTHALMCPFNKDPLSRKAGYHPTTNFFAAAVATCLPEGSRFFACEEGRTPQLLTVLLPELAPDPACCVGRRAMPDSGSTSLSTQDSPSALQKAQISTKPRTPIVGK